MSSSVLSIPSRGCCKDQIILNSWKQVRTAKSFANKRWKRLCSIFHTLHTWWVRYSPHRMDGPQDSRLPNRRGNTVQADVPYGGLGEARWWAHWSSPIVIPDPPTEFPAPTSVLTLSLLCPICVLSVPVISCRHLWSSSSVSREVTKRARGGREVTKRVRGGCGVGRPCRAASPLEPG